MLEISGAVVTTDAMGTQKDTVAQVIEQQADYVLALKGNHSDLHEAVRLFLDTEFDQSLRQRQTKAAFSDSYRQRLLFDATD